MRGGDGGYGPHPPPEGGTFPRGKAGDAAGCALKKTRILNLDKRITCDNVIKQNKIVKLMRFKRCDKG